MKKVLILMLLTMSLSLFAGLNIEIDFVTDVVGEGDEEGRFTSPYFNITNEGEAAEFTIGIGATHITNSWFMTWCHEDLSDVGLTEGCHHFSQPFIFVFPANATIAAAFQINNMGDSEGMADIEFNITGGDLTEAIILPFTFRTPDYVSNDNSVASVSDMMLTNYPNPFNPETTISYTLNKEAQVKMEVFNILGQHVSTLLNEHQAVGNHTVVWNGKDKNNNDLSSGIYFYKLTNGTQTKMNKMILLK